MFGKICRGDLWSPVAGGGSPPLQARTNIFACRGGNLPPVKCIVKGERYMKATGIVRRVDDLGRIVIPKEIRRTLKIREGDPLLTTLTPIGRFCWAIHSLIERVKAR